MCVCGGGLAIPIHPPTLPLSCWQSWWCVLVAALWIWRAVSGQGSFTTLLWPPHIHIHLLWQWDDDLNWGLCNSFQNIMCLCLFKHHLPTGDCKSYSLSLSLASSASFVKEAIFFFFKIQFSGALLSFCFEISEKHLNVNDAKKVLKT